MKIKKPDCSEKTILVLDLWESIQADVARDEITAAQRRELEARLSLSILGSGRSKQHPYVVRFLSEKEGSQSVTNCHRLKLPAADGKSYLTDLADAETLLRLIQSVPSPTADHRELIGDTCSTCPM